MSRVCHANALVKQASDWQTRSSRVRTGVGQTSPCCNGDSVLLSRHRRAGHSALPGESCAARRLHPAKTLRASATSTSPLGSDELGDEIVPDYLTSVREGAFYAWPYAYWGRNEDPRRTGE
jgi:hypothetical protein